MTLAPLGERLGQPNWTSDERRISFRGLGVKTTMLLGGVSCVSTVTTLELPLVASGCPRGVIPRPPMARDENRPGEGHSDSETKEPAVVIVRNDKRVSRLGEEREIPHQRIARDLLQTGAIGVYPIEGTQAIGVINTILADQSDLTVWPPLRGVKAGIWIAGKPP